MPLLQARAAKTHGYIKELIRARKSLRIDIGCGRNKQPGPDVVGLDARPLPGVDIVHDLETFPWPLPTDSVRVAFMSHFFEHVKPWLTLPLMAELHRVMLHDGQVLAAGPYGAEFRFVQDPTHCNPINEATFAYWDRAHPSRLWEVYEPPIFHLESFDILPAGSSRDFQAILRCCKAETPEDCKHLSLAETLRPSRKTKPARRETKPTRRKTKR
jgi:hypothetical protein